MRQRRRAERGDYSQLRDRSQPVVNRRDVEKKQRQLLLGGAGFVVAIVVGLLGYGWFDSSFQPPRKTIAEISGESIKLADLVPYSALEAFDAGGTLNPDTGLNSLVRDAVVRAYASELEVEVTAEEIDTAIISRFETLPADASEPVDALTADGRDELDSFLGIFNVSEDDYRQWLAGRLYVSELQDHFNDVSPEIAEQVSVEWIITASTVTAQEAADRINAGEEFAAVADELTTERVISGPGGVVGWVPRGAIEELDTILFTEELVLNELIGPLVTSAGSVVLRVNDGPSEQPVDPVMRGFLATNAFQSWLNDKVLEAAVDSDGLTPEDSQWVIDQII
ncbi:MAG: peptidylprolyl isomerase [Chloroflexi bacterium]|nr:peptidylprolyl isomerase [Chloroflexota bacterium]